MRPVKLVMDAFISYRHAEIDFNEIGSRLYLISGKTGAGKTTVFDAMMFALYGETTNGDRRKSDTVHSNFAGPSEPTKVDFTFEEAGKLCRAVRTINFTKSRATGEYIQNAQPTVVFYEEGKPAITGQTNVNRRITELTHLDAKQFCRTVMLAQGEFRRFLDSDSSERLNILRKLFNTDEYGRFQEILKNAAKISDNRYSSIIAGINDEVTRLTEVLPDEDSTALKAPDAELADELKAVIGRERALEHELSEKIGALDKAHDKLVDRRTEAAAHNEAIDRKDEALAKYRKLLDAAGEMHVLEDKVRLAEKAYRYVRPNKDRADGLRRDIERSRADAEKQNRLKSYLTAEAEKRRASAAEAENRGPQADALQGRISVIESSLGKYDELENAKADMLHIKNQLAAAERSAVVNASELKAALALSESTEKRLGELKGIESAVTDTEHKLKDVREKSAALDGMLRDVRRTESDEVRLLAVKRECIELMRDEAEKKTAYDSLYGSFLNNLAGQLGEKLESDIRTAGYGICPVCGHRHSSIPDGIVRSAAGAAREADVEEAKLAFESASKARSEKRSEFDALDAAIRERKLRLAETAKMFGIEADREGLGAALTVAARASGNEMRMLTAELDKNKALEAEYIEKRKLLEDNAAGIEKLREDGERLRANVSSLETKLAERSGYVTEAAKTLRFAGRTEAEKALKDLNESRSAIVNAINETRADLAKCESELSAVSGKFDEQLNTCARLENELREADNSYIRALHENGFPDDGAYSAALLPAGGDAEKWITSVNAELNRYISGLETARRISEERSADAQGFTRTNMEALEAELRVNEAERRDARNMYMAKKQLADGVDASLVRIERLTDEKRASGEALARLKKLSDMANGTNSEGGRRTFENYVLAANFRDIIDAANERLALTSNGRFELVYREEALRSNSMGGLDMDIIDHLNDHRRRTGTLSGGEGFQVSMALALALSDVVQRYAGSIRIDSMFIDEGFGSLDADALDNAIRMLDNLAGSDKQIGIISHVERLDENIKPKLAVTCGSDGSSIRLER